MVLVSFEVPAHFLNPISGLFLGDYLVIFVLGSSLIFILFLFSMMCPVTVCVFNKVAFVVSESSFPHPFN